MANNVIHPMGKVLGLFFMIVGLSIAYFIWKLPIKENKD
jgi:hypothetical protein